MSKNQSLPIIQIDSPCSMDWGELTGSDQSRFCDSCQKSVLNFESMTAADIHDALARGEDICARIARDAQGNLLTADRTNAHARRNNVLSKAAAFAASALAIAIAGCSRDAGELTKQPTDTVEPPPPITAAMGGICFEPIEAELPLDNEQADIGAENGPVKLMGRVSMPSTKLIGSE